MKWLTQKKFATPTLTPIHRPQKKIVNMNVDISETIKDRELGFQI